MQYRTSGPCLADVNRIPISLTAGFQGLPLATPLGCIGTVDAWMVPLVLLSEETCLWLVPVQVAADDGLHPDDEKTDRHLTETRRVWPWSILVPFFEEDMRTRVIYPSIHPGAVPRGIPAHAGDPGAL
jgi:hypothetical protein